MDNTAFNAEAESPGGGYQMQSNLVIIFVLSQCEIEVLILEVSIFQAVPATR